MQPTAASGGELDPKRLNEGYSHARFNKKYSRLPSILRYKDQIIIMKELITIGAAELSHDMDGMIFALDLLMDSHQSNGVFEFNEEDRDVFTAFIYLLRNIGKINQEVKSPPAKPGAYWVSASKAP